jgi:hypothetical protein
MWYGYAADALVAVHLAYVGYVVLGQVAIILAAPFKWQWARNPWFRFTHLLAIGIVAYEEFNGIRCPLTVWEEQLRVLGGQSVDIGQTFMGRMFHDLLFYPDTPHAVFAVGHVAFAVLVLQAFIMCPPRFFRSGLLKAIAGTPETPKSEGPKGEAGQTDTKEQAPVPVVA